MDVTTTTLPTHSVVRCAGRLNMLAAPGLRRTVQDALAAGPPRVVLDLGGVGFLDSSGLGALIGGLKDARNRGGDLRIAGVSDQVRAVLKLTNMDRVLRPYPDAEAAADGW